MIAVLTFLFLRETKELSLEEIAHNDFGQALIHKAHIDLEQEHHDAIPKEEKTA